MSFDLITRSHLQQVGATKWTKHPGALGASIAEMDFGTAPAVAKALHDIVNRGMLSYLPKWMAGELAETTAAWVSRRYAWHIDAADIVPTGDVMQTYEFALRHLISPAGKVILPTPAYGPFFALAAITGHAVIEVPMTRTDGRWQMDLDGLSAAFEQGGELLVLCNPHNPLGAVATRDELMNLSHLVAAHGGRVFADEIHAPIVYDGATHIPYASVSEEAANHALTAVSASKGFNVAGLQCAQMILTNDRDRQIAGRLYDYLSHRCSVPGATATIAVYTEGDAWLRTAIEYLDRNRLLATAAFDKTSPISATLPEATFLMWLDVRAASIGDDPGQYFRNRAGVDLSDGSAFGSAGLGHVRLNLAMPRPLLEDAVERMIRAVDARTELTV